MTPPSDPYAEIPNLSNVTSGTLEETRAGDPSRFYGGPGTGDSVGDRIGNKPRCRVWNSTGYVASSFGGIDWTNVEYDISGMAANARATQLIVCKVPGPYIVKGHVEYISGVGPFWTRLIANFGTARSATISSVTTGPPGGGLATHHECPGFWDAITGDTLLLYVTALAPADIGGGQYSLYMQACMGSTIGSDN